VSLIAATVPDETDRDDVHSTKDLALCSASLSPRPDAVTTHVGPSAGVHGPHSGSAGALAGPSPFNATYVGPSLLIEAGMWEISPECIL
jgi:hypothetical protein